MYLKYSNMAISCSLMPCSWDFSGGEAMVLPGAIQATVPAGMFSHRSHNQTPALWLGAALPCVLEAGVSETNFQYS